MRDERPEHRLDRLLAVLRDLFDRFGRTQADHGQQLARAGDLALRHRGLRERRER